MMRRATVRLSGLAAAVMATMLALASVAAGEAPSWQPKPARGKGEACVADTGWMRRNHMHALSHQRDATVHEGSRGARFSLNGCLDCHAVADADGKAVSYASGRHFCRTCHDYAAVRVDCFECHASRPAPGTTAGAGNPAGEAAAMAAYLRSVRP